MTANRRPVTAGWLVVLALGLGVGSPAADAQPPAKVPRIGLLAVTLGVTRSHDGFLQGLRDLGYVEGQNIAIERRTAEGKLDRLPALAAELVRLDVALIVALGTGATRAAREATTTIPIIMWSSDPVGIGLVASLARPGGNITGLSGLSVELSGKRLELLKEIAPRVTRVALLALADYPSTPLQLRELEAAGRPLQLHLQVLPVRGPDEFESAFAAVAKERAGALVVLTSPVLAGNVKRIADLAARHRLPAIAGQREFVVAGGLMSYGVSLFELGRRAAAFADKILRGARPADLPVEQPTRFELVVNLRVVKALGLTIPQSILLQATEAIQ